MITSSIIGGLIVLMGEEFVRYLLPKIMRRYWRWVAPKKRAYHRFVALYKKSGRHRGRFYGYVYVKQWWLLAKQKHRGDYQPQPAWAKKRPRLPWKDDSITWTGTLTITPYAGINTFPALLMPSGPPPPPIDLATMEYVNSQLPVNEEKVRDVVRDELASTPIYTGLKYGRFGDSEFDLTNPTPVWPPVWPFLPDGSLRDLKAEGWVDLGSVNSDE